MTPTERDELAAAWCVKMADAQLTGDEEAELDTWLNEDPDNREVFERMARIWLVAPQAAELPEMIAMRADALEAMRAANEGRWSRVRVARWFLPLVAVAASAMLAFGSVFVGFTPLGTTSQIYKTGIGERRSVRLQDGSRLSLDAASQVEVAYTAGARELHLLSGRAKFDVAHDIARPFSVTAGDRTVVATGTAFSVEIVRREMRVVLYQGHVRVVAAPDPRGRSVALAGTKSADEPADELLKPGRTLVASLDRPVATISLTDLRRSLGWEGGQLSFTDDPLLVAVERVNRYATTPVIVEGGAGTLPISGSFNAGDVNAFVNTVTALYPLRVAHRDGAIILSYES